MSSGRISSPSSGNSTISGFCSSFGYSQLLITGSNIRKVTQATSPKITAIATVIMVLLISFFLFTGLILICSVIKSLSPFCFKSGIRPPSA